MNLKPLTCLRSRTYDPGTSWCLTAVLTVAVYLRCAAADRTSYCGDRGATDTRWSWTPCRSARSYTALRQSGFARELERPSSLWSACHNDDTPRSAHRCAWTVCASWDGSVPWSRSNIRAQQTVCPCVLCTRLLTYPGGMKGWVRSGLVVGYRLKLS